MHRATAPFTVGGKQYPAGSFVVKAAQAFRAHVMDMFEPQDHPDDIPYPGGPPRPPYDVTGYNIAYSMGIKYDRILDGFDGPFEKVPDLVTVTPGVAATLQGGSPAGYLLSHQMNDAFVAVNRLLKANEEVHWLKTATYRQRQGLSGRHDVRAREGRQRCRSCRSWRPIRACSFDAVASRPAGAAMKLQARAHRSVGSVRRIDAVRVDALDSRTVPVPVRGRVPAGRSTPAT